MKIYKLQFAGNTHIYYEIYTSLESALDDRARFLKAFSTSEANLYVGEGDNSGRFKFRKANPTTGEII